MRDLVSRHCKAARSALLLHCCRCPEASLLSRLRVALQHLLRIFPETCPCLPYGCSTTFLRLSPAPHRTHKACHPLQLNGGGSRRAGTAAPAPDRGADVAPENTREGGYMEVKEKLQHRTAVLLLLPRTQGNDVTGKLLGSQVGWSKGRAQTACEREAGVGKSLQSTSPQLPTSRRLHHHHHHYHHHSPPHKRCSVFRVLPGPTGLCNPTGLCDI